MTPGGEILSRIEGWPRVKRALDAIADIEARGIDPAAVAPNWWRHLHNRITCNISHRAYTSSQHAAWLRRRRVVLWPGNHHADLLVHARLLFRLLSARVFDNGRSNIRIEIGDFALGDFFEALSKRVDHRGVVYPKNAKLDF